MRDYAQIQIKIWNDDDFRALTPAAQHLYFLLLSSPSLSYCGVGDWRPARLAALAAGWDAGQVRRAGGELVRRLFIVVDEATEEFLVRSYVRNDPLMKQPNLGTSMARAFATVASAGIRGVIVHELQRLKEEQPALAGWRSQEAAELLKKAPIDPSVHPCDDPSVDPSIEGGIDPSLHPSVHPSVGPGFEGQADPRVNPSVGPSVDTSVDPSPTTATATSTFMRGEIGKVGGGPGEEGKPTDGLDTPHDTEPIPPLPCHLARRR